MITDNDITMMVSVFVAFVLSAAIGWERQGKQSGAGLRTHMLVAAGAACFTVASIYGFGPGSRDPARMAAQIVAGIGFLGAGVIFRSEGGVKGLTTAASVWMVAAIGVLCGCGLYVLATFATILTWLTLTVVKTLERRFSRGPGPLLKEEEKIGPME